MPMETRGIDHVIVTVRDMDKTVENYQKLGFTITPRTFHPFGTANNLIVFQSNFFEILGVTAPDKVEGIGSLIKGLLDQREGVSHFALLSTDAKADHREFLKKGLNPSDVSYFERPITLPDGSASMAKVSVCTFGQPSTPLVMLFVSQQHDPNAIWVPEWQIHPNGAEDITSVIIASLHPKDEFYERFEALFGSDALTTEGQDLIAQTPNGIIEVRTPESVRRRFEGGIFTMEERLPYIVASTIKVADLKKLETLALKNGVALTKLKNGGLMASPVAANGVVLEFIA